MEATRDTQSVRQKDKRLCKVCTLQQRYARTVTESLTYHDALQTQMARADGIVRDLVVHLGRMGQSQPPSDRRFNQSKDYMSYSRSVPLHYQRLATS